MKKLALLTAAAVGYVLGTRAGRGRYEQIKRQAEKVWRTEPVQNTAHHAQDAAQQAAAEAGQRVAETAKNVSSTVAEKAKDVSETVTEKVKTAADFARDDDASSDAGSSSETPAAGTAKVAAATFGSSTPGSRSSSTSGTASGTPAEPADTAEPDASTLAYSTSSEGLRAEATEAGEKAPFDIDEAGSDDLASAPNPLGTDDPDSRA